MAAPCATASRAAAAAVSALPPVSFTIIGGTPPSGKASRAAFSIGSPTFASGPDSGRSIATAPARPDNAVRGAFTAAVGDW